MGILVKISKTKYCRIDEAPPEPEVFYTLHACCEVFFFDMAVVTISRLQTILSQLDLHHIDYFSLDVEGLEEEVLKTVDWKATTVELLTIEDGNEWGTPNARNFLIDNLGYKKIQDLQWDSVVAKNFM